MDYAPTRSFLSRSISADNGQGMGLPIACQMFQCQTWDGNTPVAPKLVRSPEGRHECPACGASYGTP